MREALGELSDEERVEIGAVRRLHESNPMIGTRGVRLGFVRNGVYQMQVRALCTAVANLFARGRHPMVEIMIPLVVDAEELRIARGWVCEVLDEIGHPELRSTVITVGRDDRDTARGADRRLRSPSTRTSSPSARTT